MVSNENKNSMSLINDPFDDFSFTFAKYIYMIGSELCREKINIVAELFDYLIVTKDIWRFHISITKNGKFLDVLLYKIRSFRLDPFLSETDKLFVNSIFENMEHRLDLLCSATIHTNKLCFNKLSHSTLRMCTMHKNKEVEKANMSKVIFVKDIYFPTNLATLISLYVYS
jgi:hypothetical protein